MKYFFSIISFFSSKNKVERNNTNEEVERNNNTNEEVEKTNEESIITYKTHIQDYGWSEYVNNGEILGTGGSSKRIEAIKIKLNLVKNNIKYQVHVQDYGWMEWKNNGEMAGTNGENKRIEAIKIQLENTDLYTVKYRTYVEDSGWTEWKYDGEVSGTTGENKKIEAIQIKMVKNPNVKVDYQYNEDNNTETVIITSDKELSEIDDKNWKISEDKLRYYKVYDVNDIYNVVVQDIDGIKKKIEISVDKIIEPISMVKYYSHIQDYGWEEKYSKIDGDISGTEKNNKRLEAIRISLGTSEELNNEADLQYKVYIQNSGWQSWKKNGELAGTTGEYKKIEAIKIQLDKVEGYTVEYRVYIKDYGWQKWKENGEISGILNKNTEIQAIQIKIVKKEERIREPFVEYKAHVQNIGWQSEVKEEKEAGTTGKSLGIEAIRINLKGIEEDANVQYQVHVSDVGWQNWVSNNEEAGTTGKGRSLEAIKIKLENLEDYSIEYRVHISGYGWQKWRKNGELAGTTGLSKKIEAIQIRIVYKGTEEQEPELIYKSHIQDIGWQDDRTEGFVSGTEGKSKRIEAIKISLTDSNAKVLYRTHVQNIGWQNWTSNGSLAGTTGQSKRIEAIQIKLEGLDDYTVEYQVHIQDYGWSDWMIDGEIAGTLGESKRIEAIKIKLVPKYYRQYLGIDVSEFNGTINWQSVKNSGIQFAMIRCGYRGYRTGKIVEDSQFRNNIIGASKNGIKVGLYFFSQATSIAEGVEEANYTIDLARKYDVTYPIAIDSEMSGSENNDGRADGLNQAVRTNGIVAFCNQVKNNGYIPMVYASRDWLYNNLQVDRILSYETWLAHYTGNPNIKSNYKYNYTMWQYTSSGSVSGINGRVDMNVGYKKY